MKIAHQQRSREATVDVYPCIDDGLPTVYYLRTFMGRGTGSLNEPSVYVEFTPEGLRDFAVAILGMIAVEEARS